MENDIVLSLHLPVHYIIPDTTPQDRNFLWPLRRFFSSVTQFGSTEKFEERIILRNIHFEKMHYREPNFVEKG